jgi:hypothetical protein
MANTAAAKAEDAAKENQESLEALRDKANLP